MKLFRGTQNISRGTPVCRATSVAEHCLRHVLLIRTHAEAEVCPVCLQ